MQVVWKQVIWGIAMQFIFGLIVLRWDVGRNIIDCLGDKVTTFLAYTDAGSSFVYGHLVTDDDSVFAFKVSHPAIQTNSIMGNNNATGLGQ